MEQRRDSLEKNATLAWLGEDRLIARIAEWSRHRVTGVGDARPPWAGLDVPCDLGDDAAVVRPVTTPDAPATALTTDMLVEGSHFFPDHPPEDLGYKALASNLSDLAAMGAWPAWFLVSLGAPGATSVAWVEALYRGMAEAVRSLGALCLGGDSVRAESRTISIVAGGMLAPGFGGLRRMAARPGMALYATGTLGDSGAGLWLLQHPRRRPRKGGLPRDVATLIARHRRSEARVAAGVALGRLCPDAAAMDLSDGLARDLPRMARASGCGFDIELAALPVSGALRRFAAWVGEPAEELALLGGEDYELLFATDEPEERWRGEVERAVPVTRIGVARGGAGVRWLGNDGEEIRIETQGFEHFEA